MSLNVAIIEDEVLIAEVLAMHVRYAGYEVAGIFLSGKEALEAMDECHVDFMFIDINLGGGIDGITLAVQLVELCDVPVIFVSGYSDIATIRRAATIVPYGYLLKPFSSDTVSISLEIAKARRDAERKSIQHQKRYKKLFESMPAAYAFHQVRYDEIGNAVGYELVEFNEGMRLVINEIASGAEGYLEGIFPDSEMNWVEILQRVSKLNKMESFELYSSPLTKWFNIIVYSPFAGECGLLMMDITQRKKMEEELRMLNAQLENLAEYQQNILETERSIIAGNIHDYLGQYLTAISMDLSYIEKHFEKFTREKMSEFIAGTKAAISEAVKSVRNLCTDLRADVLENLGLASAIEWYVKERLQNAPIKVEFVLEAGEIEIPMQRATHCFRIFQESITNVLRHSEATHVWVSLKEKDGTLFLEIRDNGVGISPDAHEKMDAYGLIGMRERARLCGGILQICNIEPQGTSVQLMVPLAK